MAVRKNNSAKGGKKPAGKTRSAKPAAALFWLAFFVVVAGLFIVNQGAIRKTLSDTGLLDRLSNRPAEAGDEAPSADIPEPVENTPPAVTPPTPPPSATPPSGGDTPAPPPENRPQPASPPAVPPATPRPAAPPQTPATAPPSGAAGTWERGLYFTKIDTDGTIMRTRVMRKFPASDSPMLDSLGALLSGPSAGEKRQGLMSLIPQGTRILSATVRGSTAYISFSEEFQYNTFGVEGYAAQLKQIVWTATEFDNVKDVQILIEGRRVDYLGEGIWIGSPVNRDTL